MKLYRSVLYKGLLTDHERWAFMSYCLLKASRKERTQIVDKQKVRLLPGQFVFGRKKASEDLHLSEQEIRTCVKICKKSEFLTIKSTNKFSIISIVNWHLYQDRDKAANQQFNQQITSKQPAANHKQEGEKEREEEKDTPPAPSFEEKQKQPDPQLEEVVVYFKTAVQEHEDFGFAPEVSARRGPP